jgi:hypothetical protein
MRQTKGAISFLIAEYRAVLKNAFLASLAAGIAVSASAEDLALSSDIELSESQTYDSMTVTGDPSIGSQAVNALDTLDDDASWSEQQQLTKELLSSGKIGQDVRDSNAVLNISGNADMNSDLDIDEGVTLNVGGTLSTSTHELYLCGSDVNANAISGNPRMIGLNNGAKLAITGSSSTLNLTNSKLVFGWSNYANLDSSQNLLGKVTGNVYADGSTVQIAGFADDDAVEEQMESGGTLDSTLLAATSTSEITGNLNLQNGSKLVVKGYENGDVVKASDYDYEGTQATVSGLSAPTNSTLNVGGMLIVNNSSASIDNGTLNVNGEDGINVLSNGTFEAENATITSKGGFDLDGGSTATLTSSTLSTSDDLDIEGGSTVTLTDSTVSLNGADLDVYGSSALNASGTTLTAGAINISNGSDDASSAVFENGSKVTADGLELKGDASLTLSASSMTLSGNTGETDDNGTTMPAVRAGMKLVDTSDGSTALDNTSTKGRVKLQSGANLTIGSKAAVEVFGDEYSYTEQDEDEEDYGTTYTVTVDNTQQFDVDSASTLTISDLGEMTLEEVNALKAKLFTSSSTGTLAGYTIDVPDGSIPFSDAGQYDGTTAIADRLVTDVTGDVTGTKNFGAAALASGQSALSIGSGASLSLNAASVNDGKFATTSDGSVANVTVADGGYIQLSGDGTIGSVTGEGTLNGKSGSITAGDVSVGAVNFTDSATVTVSSLTAEDASTISSSTTNVLGNASFSDLTLENASLSVAGILSLTGTANLDPSYVYADGLDLGSGSLLNILKDTTVYVAADESDYSSSSGAALVLGTTLDLSSGAKIYIDNSLENDDAPTTDSEALSGTQIALVNGKIVVTESAVEDAGDGAVITLADSDNSVDVYEDGSIELATKYYNGRTYNLFDQETDVTTDDLVSDNALYDVSIENGMTVTYSLNSSGMYSTAASTGLMPQLASAIVARAESTDTSANYFDSDENSAVGYVSRYLDNATADGARSLNTLAGFAFANGSAQNALASSEAGYGAIEERAGYRAKNASSIGEVKGHDITVWATPLYRHQSSDSYDFDGGDYGASSNLYGAAVGADMAFVPSFRGGVAVHVGSGKSESEGDLDYVQDEFDFYGVGLYGIFEQGRFSLLGDIGYTYVDNDAEGSGLEASGFGTDVFTAGVNAKYAFQAGSVGIEPHAGVRYVSSHLDGYDVKADGVKYMDVGSLDQNVVKFPLGVSFSTEIKAGSWTVKPVGDITLTAAVGDTDVDSDVRLVGFDGFSVNGDVVDPFSARASVGVDAQMGSSLGLGLGVAYTGSKNMNEASVSGTVRYAF